MPKTLHKQLQDAVDKGDLKMAELIVEAMRIEEKAASKKKKAAAKAVKDKPVKKAAPRKSRITVQEAKIVNEAAKPSKLIIPTEEEIIDFTNEVCEDDDDIEDMTDNRPNVVRPTEKRSSDRTFCRTERMDIPKKRVNKFNDDGTLEAQDKPSNNPQLAALYAPVSKIRETRPKRKSATKAKVKCSCGKIDIIAFHLAPRIAEGELYRCNDCIVGDKE